MSIGGTISECPAGTYRDGQEDITSNIIEKSYNTDITCHQCLPTLSADGNYVTGGKWQDQTGSSECKTLPTTNYANGFTSTPHYTITMNDEGGVTYYNVNRDDGFYEYNGRIFYCGWYSDYDKKKYCRGFN